ncbi:mfs alpha-glucoside transporter [Trichoderma arundinaceum]|uniref:Mfs alpha-glucoside transporter n=1 Tax=Trichoderma arundinaceum TaxID=490622 RepID=A0A395NI44_TRIAR|nr:mfs alpha-glucoside transporter [Trichoderma arundinaceum]
MAVTSERDDVLDVYGDLDPAAAIATDDEHSLSIKEAFKRYPTSVFWAIAMSLTIVMEGYDTILISSLFAYPSFVEKYGTYQPGLGEKTITSSWQAGLNNASSCGAIIGLIINGYITEKFGHRVVTMTALVVMSAFIFITFFAPSIEVLTAGQVLVGIPWGIFAIMGSAYSSEVCPLALRGYLTSFVNICWVIGQFVAAGALQGLVNNNTVWAFRIPFAIQWAWPVPLFLFALLAPDSPWWLVRKGRLADAEKSIRKLSTGLTDTQVKQKLAMMVHTDRFEKAVQAESSYRDCFKGTNLRRTEIACVILAAQTLPGQPMCYSASYFFTQAGLPSGDAYKLNLGSIALAFIATCFSWVLMTFFGRRTLLITGLSLLTLDLLVIGCLSYAAASSAQWAQSALAMLWLGIYSATLGPQSFALAAEISATRLRSQTISLARNAYNVINVIDNTAETYLINPTAANLKGKTAFVWFGLGVLTTTWAIFRLPETKNRTYEELDVLFERRISAWRFKSTQIDVVAETEIIQAGEKGKVHQIEHTEDI